MTIVPYRRNNWFNDPFGELENLHREVNQLFNLSETEPYRGSTLLGGQWTPSVDIYDSKDNVLVKADLPGLDKKNIELSIHENALIIKGEKKEEDEQKDEKYYKAERFYGSFCRTIPLPAEVDATKVDAKYKDGVLSVTLPKREEAKPKQVSIKVN